MASEAGKREQYRGLIAGCLKRPDTRAPFYYHVTTIVELIRSSHLSVMASLSRSSNPRLAEAQKIIVKFKDQRWVLMILWRLQNYIL